MPTPPFGTLQYQVEGRIARITLDRPERLNAISPEMPGELRRAVAAAGDDEAVHVVVLAGAGRAFCAGYDLKLFAEQQGGGFTQAMPWDPLRDYRVMRAFTDDILAPLRCLKPTIAAVHGHAVAGGSDIALACDLVVMAEDARIGYPPARVWGCPTTALWAYRVGAERAKRLLFTGDLIDGREAARIGLVLEAVPGADLSARVEALAQRIAAVPKNQLAMHKLVVNSTLDAQGLGAAQTLATFFDGVARHSPEGLWFKRYAELNGFHAAVAWRDGGRPIPEGAEAAADGARAEPPRGGEAW